MQAFPRSLAPGEAFARVIARLSAEIQRLTREIPLRQGRLQELEFQRQQNEFAIGELTEQIRAALEELRIAENDIVQIESLVRAACGGDPVGDDGNLRKDRS